MQSALMARARALEGGTMVMLAGEMITSEVGLAAKSGDMETVEMYIKRVFTARLKQNNAPRDQTFLEEVVDPHVHRASLSLRSLSLR